MAYSQYPIEEASVRSLRLDVSNYRFPINQPTESAAMNYLFAAHGVMDVARIILRDGYIDNELPLVIEENSNLVILEGNRRLSALRALLDPSLVPSHQTELARLLRRYAPEAADLPDKVRVMRFPNRESAAPVLARLHIGESKKAWSLDEQAKFVLAQLTDGVDVEILREQLPAIKDVVRLIRMGRVREMLKEINFDDPDLEEYAASDRLAMSSFEYAYRNSDIQSAIGIAFDDNGNLASRPSLAAHVGALARLLRGFKNGELNTRRGLKPGTEEFENLLAEMHGDPAETSEAHDPGSDNSKASTNAVGRRSATEPGPQVSSSGGPSGKSTGEHRPQPPTQYEAPRRGLNNPETKKNLDFSGIDETPLPLPLKHRVRELRRIDVVDFPAAAVMLIRSVLEAAIKEHYGVKSGKEATGMLSSVMTRVTADYGKNGQLAHAISTINRTGKGTSTTPGTGEWFNLVTHSVNVDVNAKQVHEAWRIAFPLVRFLLNSPPSSSQTP